MSQYPLINSTINEFSHVSYANKYKYIAIHQWYHIRHFNNTIQLFTCIHGYQYHIEPYKVTHIT